VLWNQWQDANTLIGVRFTHDTYYGLLDIDAGSDYCTPKASPRSGPPWRPSALPAPF
jgi:hypothetical protein